MSRPAPDVRVVLADDHPVYRDGLARLLADLGGIEVVGLAGDGIEAIEVVARTEPHVVVMDLRMPELDGVEATRRIVQSHPGIGVLALSMFDDDEMLFAALAAGARGYVLKDADDTEVASAIVGIARGEAIFGSAVATRLLAGLTSGVVRRAEREPFPELSGREREVLDLVARGLGNHDIAARLYLSERTVRNYVSSILTKLGLPHRSAVIAVARDAGLGAREGDRLGD